MAIIIPVDQLQPAFRNALDHLYGNGQLSTVGQTVREWRTHFDCYLLHDKEWNWEAVGFKNEQQHTMFILKWS